MTRITIIDGHPDPSPDRYIHALAAAYADGATQAGHAVRQIKVAAAVFPVIRTRQEWEEQQAPADIAAAQDSIAWAEHVVILYPLWLGDVPALLKAFLEQVNRPDVAFEGGGIGMGHARMKGRSARVVVTMGMPGPIYRFFYRAHSVKSLERNVLRLVGFGPVRHSIIGSVEGQPVTAIAGSNASGRSAAPDASTQTARSRSSTGRAPSQAQASASLSSSKQRISVFTSGAIAPIQPVSQAGPPTTA